IALAPDGDRSVLAAIATMDREQLAQAVVELTAELATSARHGAAARKLAERRRQKLVVKTRKQAMQITALQARLRGFTFLKETPKQRRRAAEPAAPLRQWLSREGWHRLGFKRNYGY
ncbi:unnamed protein product, partial [Prorocentrum cordatum]